MIFSLVTGLSSTTSAAGVGLRFWLPVPIRWPGRLPDAGEGLPVLARAVSRRAYGFWTTPGLTANSRFRCRQCGLPVGSTRSAPGIRISKLDSSPVDASVYTSPGASRHPAQKHEVKMVRYSFPVGSFIPYCTPVYPDDCAPLRSRLCKLLRPNECNSEQRA